MSPRGASNSHSPEPALTAAVSRATESSAEPKRRKVVAAIVIYTALACAPYALSRPSV
jgi:hypothetical protein